LQEQASGARPKKYLERGSDNASQWSLGLDAGFLFLLEDTADLEDAGADVSKIGFPVMVGAGYQLPAEFEAGGLGMANLIVGGKLGYLNNVLKVESTILGVAYESHLKTIPIMAFGRAEAGILYAELGLGLHAWTWDIESGGMDLGDNGLDVGLYLSSGVNLPLSEQLSLRGGLTFMSLSFDVSENEEDAPEGRMFGVTVGASYKL
jgi:hypothetical protein